MEINQINALVLAYIGDSIYETYIREYLINKKINKVNELQQEAKKYVSAKGQAYFLDVLIKENILKENELEIIKRTRNTKVNSHPKHTDILTYKHASALEALIGYLHLIKETNRIENIMEKIVNIEME